MAGRDDGGATVIVGVLQNEPLDRFSDRPSDLGPPTTHRCVGACPANLKVATHIDKAAG